MQQERSSMDCKKVERNHSKKNEKEKKARPERGKKASSKVDELVIKRKKGRASYRKVDKQESTSKSRQARVGKQETASKSRQARVGKQESASKRRQARVVKQESASKSRQARIDKQESISKNEIKAGRRTNMDVMKDSRLRRLWTWPGVELEKTLDVTEVEVGCPGKVENRDGSKRR
ncbi:hypothetical protein Tco_0917321 [Tanacetum coccineum]